MSDTNLSGFWGTSVESITDEDNDSDRRGSIAGGSSGGNRRGSKLSEMLDKKKKGVDKKRKRDKQGEGSLIKIPCMCVRIT